MHLLQNRMRKTISTIIIFACLNTALVFSQVGVNTEDPQATLDITNATTGTSPEGLLVPRLTGNEIEAMTTSASIGSVHNGLLVFATQASNAVNPVIVSTGFWYYDALDSTWKILEREERRSSVVIDPTGAGDYRSLQAAYDEEAKKKYIPTVNNAPVEFICQNGAAGDLYVDGSIPYIKVKGSTTSPATIGDIEVYNCNITFEGNITANNITCINSYVLFPITVLTAFKAKDVMLKKCLFDINVITYPIEVSRLLLDQSSGTAGTGAVVITFTPDTDVDYGLYMNYSSLKVGTNINLNFNGTNTYNDYIYLDNASLINMQGYINANAPLTNAVVYANQGSKGTFGSIKGTAIPKHVFYASNGGKIDHFRYNIVMTTKNSPFYATEGGDIYLGAGGTTTTASTLTKDPSSTDVVNALYAVGGNVRVITDASATYTVTNYDYALMAEDGGRVATLGKVTLGGSTVICPPSMTPGTINMSNGSVIYNLP